MRKRGVSHQHARAIGAATGALERPARQAIIPAGRICTGVQIGPAEMIARALFKPRVEGERISPTDEAPRNEVGR